MTMTTGNESLFWQHVEDGDYSGAVQHRPTATELLRASADKYLADAVETGEVTSSRIFMSKQLGKFVGYTTVETRSGVKIMKISDGGFNLEVEYEEPSDWAPAHTYRDLKVEIELPADGDATVREDRQEFENWVPNGNRGNRTLSKNGRERVMGEVTKLIWQVYE